MKLQRVSPRWKTGVSPSQDYRLANCTICSATSPIAVSRQSKIYLSPELSSNYWRILDTLRHRFDSPSNKRLWSNIWKVVMMISILVATFLDKTTATCTTGTSINQSCRCYCPAASSGTAAINSAASLFLQAAPMPINSRG